jgi:hypothetical protein
MVKADLEDDKVCRWLARHLICRAASRLPCDERARWREESIQNAFDLPGRLPPLLWALDTYVRAGRWGRMRGAPSRSQVLLARIRAAWQRLRSLPTAQARARTQQLHPASIQSPPASENASTYLIDMCRARISPADLTPLKESATKLAQLLRDVEVVEYRGHGL